jgi:hypothetical protein
VSLLAPPASWRSSRALLAAVPTVSAGFRVPFALDLHGVLVAPDDARRRAAYRCPQCASAVVLHAGERKRRHFHHTETTRGCTPETVAHFTAKALVARAVDAWRAGGESPVFVRKCAATGCDATARQRMPAKVARASIEHAMPSGRVVDVALLGPADVVIAAIEVFRTHRVDDAKALDLGAPWIEVDAAAVCASEGRVLVPIRDKFLPWLCAAHAPSRRERARGRLDGVRTRAAAIRALPFRVDDYPGFRVARVARCPRGHDAIVWAWDGDAPPWPRPPQVVAREKDRDWHFSTPQGGLRALLPWRRTWVSTCAQCGEELPPRA